MSLLVGICGGSGSGKSTLAQRVRTELGPGRSAILSFDTYYHDQRHLSPADRAKLNYDHPETIDVELFVEHLDTLAAGRPAALPVYDFTNHARLDDQTLILEPAPILLVEGILLFAFPEIADRLDLRIYRECPQHVRYARRLARDTIERGRTPESVEAQFAASVAPMHDHFVAPSKARAHVVFEHGVLELDTICDQVLSEIEQRTASLAPIDLTAELSRQPGPVPQP